MTMTKTAFEIEPTPSKGSGKSIVRLHQKLDYQQGEQVCQQMRELVMQGHSQWEVNIVNVDFLDSITLGFLINLDIEPLDELDEEFLETEPFTMPTYRLRAYRGASAGRLRGQRAPRSPR